MFTGLVESTGEIKKIIASTSESNILIQVDFADELNLGDSVAVNGCCLTLARKDGSICQFDVLQQTLNVTSLDELQVGDLVNLERALKAGDHLGGHFVQGHVDDTGTLHDLSKQGQDYRLEIKIPKKIHKYCIDKGSLAIDGISLTIAELTQDSAVFWIIPHTYKLTHLHQCKVGKKINLEADLLAKYTEKLLASRFENI